VGNLPTVEDIVKTRTDGKPTIREITAASDIYEIVTFRGVEILLSRKVLFSAIETTYEFTHDPPVAQLMTQLNIKLRKFR
jgi:hypothetical protein